MSKEFLVKQTRLSKFAEVLAETIVTQGSEMLISADMIKIG